ncbi:hypothetical protein BDV93DRAFT_576083 [Ceratobasidium sp. AG-I]|nr:hypothetical protein BDV93DRAFT_576083 [Ceratobasidium sp. AG-I]
MDADRVVGGSRGVRVGDIHRATGRGRNREPQMELEMGYGRTQAGSRRRRVDWVMSRWRWLEGWTATNENEPSCGRVKGAAGYTWSLSAYSERNIWCMTGISTNSLHILRLYVLPMSPRGVFFEFTLGPTPYSVMLKRCSAVHIIRPIVLGIQVPPVVTIWLIEASGFCCLSLGLFKRRRLWVPSNLSLAYSGTILGGTEFGGTTFLRDGYSGTAVELPCSHHSEGGAGTSPPGVPPINSLPLR